MMKSTSPIYINVKGQLLDLSIPQVMGILKVKEGGDAKK